LGHNQQWIIDFCEQKVYNDNMEPVNNKKLSVVSETDLGMYIWVVKGEDGITRRVENEDGDIMNIVARRGDLQAMMKLAEAARYYGVEGGEPLFIEGARRVSAEEREEQIDRMEQGLIPDPQDIGNYKDELRRRGRRR
jgi:hypothetical protein